MDVTAADENGQHNESHADYFGLFPDYLHQEVLNCRGMHEILQSHNTGKEMLCGEHGLCNKIRTMHLKKFIRDKNLLQHLQIADIEDEFKDKSEMRHQMMECVAHNLGRQLTPRFLLGLAVDYELRYIYDAMYAVFKSALNQHA